MAANPNNLATDLPARGRKSNMAENNARAEARRAADERYASPAAAPLLRIRRYYYH